MALKPLKEKITKVYIGEQKDIGTGIIYTIYAYYKMNPKTLKLEELKTRENLE